MSLYIFVLAMQKYKLFGEVSGLPFFTVATVSISFTCPHTVNLFGFIGQLEERSSCWDIQVPTMRMIYDDDDEKQAYEEGYEDE